MSLMTDLICFTAPCIKEKTQRIIQRIQKLMKLKLITEAGVLVESTNLLCLWKGLLLSELVSAVGAAGLSERR